MSTLLTQSATAAFPDRPNHSGVGLYAELDTGDRGAHIAHDLGSTQSVIHVRFLFSPWGIAGGSCVVLAGLDGSGGECARLSYDADNKTLSLWTPGGVTLGAQLDVAIAWQCVELSLDTTSGQARLWINGVTADVATGDLSASTVQTIMFGVIHKQSGLAGDLYLDELCIADQYIGPVVVEPYSAHADAPSCWLVVYNASDPDAAGWAEAYRQSRGVPFANLAGLALPVSETINATQYADLVGAIGDYLADNGLSGQVMGVLLGYGVPGYVDFTGGGTLEAVPALIQTDSSTAGTVSNPLASPDPFDRPTFTDLAGVRMTARMDAPDLAIALQQINRADVLIVNGLSGSNSTIYFDPFVGSEPGYQSAFTAMLTWATGLDGMKTRLPIVLSGDSAGNEESTFTSVSDDGLFWGWSSTLPDPDIFDAPAGRRAVCAQLYLEGASATTQRSATPGNWADTPIDAGYAAAIVSSRDNPVSAVPDAAAFFNALREGWKVGEAWQVAQPLLRSGFYLVGDPLMTVEMPKAGFDVFGPLTGLEDLDPESPDAVLAGDVLTFDASGSVPALDALSHYMVRRLDAHGRSEVSTTPVSAINTSGAAQPPSLLPVWPDVDSWPVPIEAGEVVVAACWEIPIGACRVQTIELQSQADGQGAVVAATPPWQALDRFVRITLSITPEKTRYRWRFTSAGGAVRYSGWSAWVEPLDAPAVSLESIGATT